MFLCLVRWKVNIFFSFLNLWRTNCEIGWGSTWIWLFICLHKIFLLKRTSLMMRPLLVGNNKKFKLVHYHFKMGVEFWLVFYVFIFMIWTSVVMLCSNIQISSWNLLTFGCGRWDYEFHWAKFVIKSGFNYPSKFWCIMCKLERMLLLCHLCSQISPLWWTK